MLAPIATWRVATGAMAVTESRLAPNPTWRLATGAVGDYEIKVGATQHCGVGAATGAVSECEVADATAGGRNGAAAMQ